MKGFEHVIPTRYCCLRQISLHATKNKNCLSKLTPYQYKGVKV